MRKGIKALGDILPALTIAVMFVVILLLVMLAATSYRYANEVLMENRNERAIRTYVVSCIGENRTSEVSIRDYGGAPGISIRSAGSDYERRIYAAGGKLLEEYVSPAKEASPDDALVIGETDKFDVSEDGGLIRIETDSGVSYARVQDAVRD